MEGQRIQINNAFYEDLGDAWYEDTVHPIALLRAENAARNPWILDQIKHRFGSTCDILDLGCGAGFLTNFLASHGHQVTGIDLSLRTLEVAKKRDLTKSVCYRQLDALNLPFQSQSFDVICAMDFLEHVERPGQIISLAANLLRPKGLFFFHTFNRNLLSWLMVIKGVEWCVPNTPANMHVYSYFIKPVELKNWCQRSGLHIKEIHGLSPRLVSKAFWKSFFSRKVDPKLEFCKTSSLKVGYMGVAQA